MEKGRTVTGMTRNDLNEMYQMLSQLKFDQDSNKFAQRVILQVIKTRNRKINDFMIDLSFDYQSKDAKGNGLKDEKGNKVFTPENERAYENAKIAFLEEPEKDMTFSYIFKENSEIDELPEVVKCILRDVLPAKYFEEPVEEEKEFKPAKMPEYPLK